MNKVILPPASSYWNQEVWGGSQNPTDRVCLNTSSSELWLPKANRLYITQIDGEFEGDIFFPEWNHKIWNEVSHEAHVADDKNPYNYVFTKW